jgi:lipooligosaccharide transport system ATP-binding protein
MIYGMSPLSGGVLTVLGGDIPARLREVKYRVGVCQQENNLDPDLTVRENLLVFGRYYDIPRGRLRARAGELLDFMGLAHRGGARVGELSGGMLRRLMICRALVCDPALLILDEPTTGLDPQSRHQVWERLEELTGSGMSILLTTHYMEEAARLCGRVAIMDGGRILVEGAPRELVRRHVGEQVVEVTSPTEGQRRWIAESGRAHDDAGRRIVLHGGDAGEALRALAAVPGEGACTLRPATLEDLFLSLTGRGLRE